MAGIGADQQYLDPSVIAGLQGAGVWPSSPPGAAPFDPNMTPPGQLHPDVLHGVQTGFAPMPYVPSATELPSAPSQGAPAAPAQARPDFVIPSAADRAVVAKQDARRAELAAKHEVAQQKLEAKHQAEVAKYLATPEGRIEQANNDQTAVLADQGRILKEQGAVDAKQAVDESAVLEQQRVDLEKLHADQAKQAQDRAVGLAKMDDADKRAIEAEANHKVDDNRKWKEMGTGGQVLAGIAMALSGLGEAIKGNGGRNPALDIIQNAIREDVQAQVRDHEALGKNADRTRSALDHYEQRTGSLRAAAEHLESQRLTETAQQMVAAAAKYKDQRAVLNAQTGANELLAKAAALRGASGEARFDRDQKREATANAKAQVGLGYANLKQGKYEFEETMKSHGRDQALKAIELDQQGKAAEAKAVGETASKDNELGMAAPAELKKDEKGKLITDDTGAPVLDRSTMLQNQDGSTWHAPDKDTRKVLADKMTAAHEIVNILDEVAKIRDDVGGESSWGNSDARQRLDVLQNRLVVLAKSGTQGMSSDEDMKKLSSALGASDVASFRARAAGLEEGRTRTLGELNTSLHFQGNYSGKPIDIPNLAKASGPQNTEEEDNFKETIKKPAISYDEAFDQAMKPAIAQYREDRKTDPAGAAAALAIASKKAKVEAESYKDITPYQRQSIRDLATLMTSGDEQSKRNARLTLARAATDGQTPALREAASLALGEAGLSGTGQGGVTGESTRSAAGGYYGSSAAHEDAPPPLEPAKGKRK